MSFPPLSLPQRDLILTQRPLLAPKGFWFAVIVLSALLVGMVWWQGPGLWRDVQINASPVYPDAVKTIDGECTTRRGLTTCDADLIYNVDGTAYNSHVSLAFIDFHSGDYMVDVVVSEDKPELATLSLGLDMLWNRLAVFGVLFALLLGGIGAMIYNAVAAARANANLGAPARLTLVPVEITNVLGKGKGSFVTYAEKLGKRRARRTANSWFGPDDAPLMITADDGALVGVAAKHPMARLPVLLDQRLLRITDLTETERGAMLGALPPAPEAASAAMGGKAPKKLHWGRGILAFLIVIALGFAAVTAYWLYYVTSGETQFDALGMEINAMLPAPINAWGCSQLETRFGDDRAPFGCTASDYVSWK